LEGLSEEVAKKTYIRAIRYAVPALDKALAECKADKTWTAMENTTSGHAASTIGHFETQGEALNVLV
jgi:hypothetical protein